MNNETSTPPLAGDGRGGLLPCPFCGGEAQLRQCHCDQDTDDRELCVECLTDDCHANMVMWLGDEREVTFAERKDAAAAELTAAWNRRAALSAELARREVGCPVGWRELGSWYNTLCHGLMYLNEKSYGNADTALTSVINDLEALRNAQGFTESFHSLAEKAATPAPVGPGMVDAEPRQEDFDHLTECIQIGCDIEEKKAREIAIKLLYFVVNMKPKAPPAATPPGEEAK